MRQFCDNSRRVAVLLASALILTPASPIYAQKTAALPATSISYADAADLALAAPIVAEVRVTRASQLKRELAPGLMAGARRYLVEADVMALIRGTGGLPPRITYVVDMHPDPTGGWSKLKKQRFIVFARAMATRPGTVQLVSPDAQQAMTPALSVTVRDILRQAETGGAPRIVGVGQAFHTAGTVEGEGETQIFLKAADGRPLSLSVWRSPAVAKRWAVSLGEIVDEGAPPPPRDSLLWYRLACALPQRLPAESSASLDATDAAIVAEDYATVIAGLGPCARSRETRSPARSS